MLELDPAARRLSFEERYSRSRKLAELALEELRRCASGRKAPAAGPVLRLVESAGAALYDPVELVLAKIAE